MHSYITTLIAESWELIPGYEKVSRSLREAIKEGKGSCANHSTLIGRKALQDGVPAMRSILFDSSNKPSHFSSYLFVDGEWVRVSTDRSSLATYIDADRRTIEPTAVTWSRSAYGLLEPTDEATEAAEVGELVIPEIEMHIYAKARTAEDYLNIGKFIRFMNE